MSGFYTRATLLEAINRSLAGNDFMKTSFDIIKKSVDYICRNKGGDGAVREFCDIIINSLNTEKSNMLWTNTRIFFLI